MENLKMYDFMTNEPHPVEGSGTIITKKGTIPLTPNTSHRTSHIKTVGIKSLLLICSLTWSQTFTLLSFCIIAHMQQTYQSYVTPPPHTHTHHEHNITWILRIAELVFTHAFRVKYVDFDFVPKDSYTLPLVFLVWLSSKQNKCDGEWVDWHKAGHIRWQHQYSCCTYPSLTIEI